MERVRPQKKRTSSTELETLSLSWEMIQQRRLIRTSGIRGKLVVSDIPEFKRGNCFKKGFISS